MNATTKERTAEAKARRIERIKDTLARMEVGTCGVRHDCLVWRVSLDAFHVGSASINRNDATLDYEQAAGFIYDINLRTR